MQGNQESDYDYGRGEKLTVFKAISRKTNNVIWQDAGFSEIKNLNETLNEARISDIIILCVSIKYYVITILIHSNNQKLNLFRLARRLTQATILILLTFKVKT